MKECSYFKRSGKRKSIMIASLLFSGVLISSVITAGCAGSQKNIPPVANTEVIDAQCAFYTDDFSPFYLNMYTESDETESEMP